MIEFDVSAAVGTPASLAASYYPAATPSSPVLVCLPGGTYNRAYWHLGLAGYDFAEYAVQQGYSVLSIDPLGTGESSRPDQDVDMKDAAAALGVAISALPERIGATGRPVAFAHSLGGYLAILQQVEFDSYAGLAILGCTNQHVAPLNLSPDFIARAATAAGRAEMTDEFAGLIPDLYVQGSRAQLQSWFHLDDVPPEVVQADHATTQSVVPRRFCAAAIPGITADQAAEVDVPVFLAYGELDVSPDPGAEAAFYRRSPRVTSLVLPCSAHCHNMASSRHLLWDRLLSWAADLTEG